MTQTNIGMLHANMLNYNTTDYTSRYILPYMYTTYMHDIIVE